jgi:hypothetical protein
VLTSDAGKGHMGKLVVASFIFTDAGCVKDDFRLRRKWQRTATPPKQEKYFLIGYYFCRGGSGYLTEFTGETEHAS